MWISAGDGALKSSPISGNRFTIPKRQGPQALRPVFGWYGECGPISPGGSTILLREDSCREESHWQVSRPSQRSRRSGCSPVRARFQACLPSLSPTTSKDARALLHRRRHPRRGKSSSQKLTGGRNSFSFFVFRFSFFLFPFLEPRRPPPWAQDSCGIELVFDGFHQCEGIANWAPHVHVLA